MLQVRTVAGALVHRLEGWFDAQWVDKLNQPHTLRFSLSLDNPAVPDGSLESPNEIWLYNGAHELLRKFIIQETEYHIEDGAFACVVDCADHLAQLADEANDVTGSTSTRTVRQIVQSILDAQTNSRPIRMGNIVPAIADATRIVEDSEGDSLLSMLNSLREMDIGGRFMVDLNRRLNWYTMTTNNAGLVFSLQNNLAGYTERRKHRRVYNEIFVKGMRKPDNTYVGVTGGSVESTASQAIYGTRPFTIRSKKIKTADAATKIATKFLNDHAFPPIDRTLPAVDLETLKRGTVLTDEEIDNEVWVGRAVKLRIPPLVPVASYMNDTTTLNIVGITRDLVEWAKVTIEFGINDDDFFKDLADRERDTSEAAEEPEGPLNINPETYPAEIEIAHTDLEDCAATIGDEGQVVVVNATGDAHTYTTGGTAGQALKRNVANTGLEWGNAGILSVEDLSDLGVPTDAQLGEVTDDSPNNGLHFFPSEGDSNDDHLMVVLLKRASNKTGLGTPTGFCLGWVTTAGAEYGLWQFPPNGSANSDWQPVNLYSAAS